MKAPLTERGPLDFVIKVTPRAQRQPAVFVVDVGESQYKSVLQMAFLAAGTHQGHREDVSSCAVNPLIYIRLYIPWILFHFLFTYNSSSPCSISLPSCAAPSHTHTENPLASHSNEFLLPRSLLQTSHLDLPQLHTRSHSLVLSGSEATTYSFSAGTATFDTC